MGKLIKQNKLTTPFEIVHADMHSDLYPKSYNYIFGELLHKDLPKRIDFNRSKMDCTNYLIFAMACGWIEKLTYVTHHGLEYGQDLYPFHFKDWNIYSGFIELKAYEKESLKNYSNFTDEKPHSVNADKLIPFNSIFMDEYYNNEPFDYVVLCRSEDYTPHESDYLIPVIMEYIKVK